MALLRIVYFTESLFPHVDGVSVTLGRLFETLERRGIDFRVYSPFVPGPGVTWHARVRPVRYVRFPPYPAYRVSLPAGRWLTRELDAWAPALLHVVSPTPMAIRAQRYARKRRMPVVSSFHTDFVSYFRYYGVRRLEPAGWRFLRWFYNRCDATYAPSAAMAAKLEAQHIRRVALWSRGIDFERFSPAFRDADLRRAIGAADAPLLLFVGRLVREKDLADLIAVDGMLRQRGHRFVLALVGDGPMRAELETAMPEAHFAGHLIGPALSRWFASADLFVFPSTTETFGNVVQEAAASGVPAVVAGRGGPADLVEDGATGLIARPKDAEDFARHVEALLQDPARRRAMGRRAREAAAARDWEAVNGRLIESYARLLGATRPEAR